MRKPIYTEEQIVAKGKELLAKGDDVTAWKIHEALGSVGKLKRIEEVWSRHLTSASQASPAQEIVLPDDVEAMIVGCAHQVQTRMQDIYRGLIRAIQDEHARHTSLMAKDHQRRLADKQDEIDYLRKLTDDQGEEISQQADRITALESALDRAKPAPAKRVPQKTTSKVRSKSPGQSPRNIRPGTDPSDPTGGPTPSPGPSD